MEKKDAQQALQTLKANSPKKKFVQSIDLIINLKDLNLKITEQQIDLFISLSHPTGKKVKVCALIGPELKEQAKTTCDHFILSDEFERIAASKKEVKKIASNYDYFIAQANIMTLVAKHFGRIFGPKGKMPNPKSGCVVPPNANLAQLYDKLQKTVHAKAKTEYSVKARIGTEAMDEAHIIDNIMTVYNAVIHALPNDKNNVKNILLKMTMGKPLLVEKSTEETSVTKKKQKTTTKEIAEQVSTE